MKNANPAADKPAYPINSLANLAYNRLWDGLFHAATYVFGLFKLVEGIINHQLLVPYSMGIASPNRSAPFYEQACQRERMVLVYDGERSTG